MPLPSVHTELNKAFLLLSAFDFLLPEASATALVTVTIGFSWPTTEQTHLQGTGGALVLQEEEGGSALANKGLSQVEWKWVLCEERSYREQIDSQEPYRGRRNARGREGGGQRARTSGHDGHSGSRAACS